MVQTNWFCLFLSLNLRWLFLYAATDVGIEIIPTQDDIAGNCQWFLADKLKPGPTYKQFDAVYYTKRCANYRGFQIVQFVFLNKGSSYQPTSLAHKSVLIPPVGRYGLETEVLVHPSTEQLTPITNSTAENEASSVKINKARKRFIWSYLRLFIQRSEHDCSKAPIIAPKGGDKLSHPRRCFIAASHRAWWVDDAKTAFQMNVVLPHSTSSYVASLIPGIEGCTVPLEQLDVKSYFDCPNADMDCFTPFCESVHTTLKFEPDLEFQFKVPPPEGTNPDLFPLSVMHSALFPPAQELFEVANTSQGQTDVQALSSSRSSSINTGISIGGGTEQRYVEEEKKEHVEVELAQEKQEKQDKQGTGFVATTGTKKSQIDSPEHRLAAAAWSAAPGAVAATVTTTFASLTAASPDNVGLTFSSTPASSTALSAHKMMRRRNRSKRRRVEAILTAESGSSTGFDTDAVDASDTSIRSSTSLKIAAALNASAQAAYVSGYLAGFELGFKQGSEEAAANITTSTVTASASASAAAASKKSKPNLRGDVLSQGRASNDKSAVGQRPHDTHAEEVLYPCSYEYTPGAWVKGKWASPFACPEHRLKWHVRDPKQKICILGDSHTQRAAINNRATVWKNFVEYNNVSMTTIGSMAQKQESMKDSMRRCVNIVGKNGIVVWFYGSHAARNSQQDCKDTVREMAQFMSTTLKAKPCVLLQGVLDVNQESIPEHMIAHQKYYRNSWRVEMQNDALAQVAREFENFHYMDLFSESSALHYDAHYDAVHLTFGYYSHYVEHTFNAIRMMCV